MNAAGGINGRPTVRKVRNRGWTPVQYNGGDGWRFGWLIETRGKRARCRFPCDDRPRWLPAAQVKPLDLGAVK